MPVDRQIAQRWFRAAAELGHGHAQMKRLRRSSAKLGRLARRKKQRARSAVRSTAGSTEIDPELGTASVSLVMACDVGSKLTGSARPNSA